MLRCRQRIVLTVTTLVAGIALTACSLLFSTDGFNGQPPPSEEGGLRGTTSGVITPSNDGGGAASGDGGDSGAAANVPCPTFAIFCDDFESNSISKWSRNELMSGGVTSIVTTPKAHSGMYAARTFAPIAPPNDAGERPSVRGLLRFDLPNRITSGLMVFRSYVYLPTQLKSDTTFLKMYAQGVDDMNVKSGVGGTVKVDTDTSGAGADKQASMNMPVNTWVCVEWRATAGKQGHQTLLLDGKTVLDVDENTETSDGWDTIAVGFYASDGDVAQEAFFDDVAFATQPIGCF